LVKDVLLNRLSPLEMFLQNAIEYLQRHIAIPCPVGMNHQDRPAFADGKTAATGALDPKAPFIKTLFPKSRTQLLEKGFGFPLCTAGAHADQKVFAVLFYRGFGNLRSHWSAPHSSGLHHSRRVQYQIGRSGARGKRM